MSGIMMLLLAGVKKAAAAVDSYFNYVTLLLPGNGTNGAQNNTFLDSSTNNFTITRNGNTTQGTFSPFSQTGWGAYFDGTGDYLSAADNAALDFGTGDFTIEGWVYIGDGISDNAGIVSKRNNSTFNPGDYRISYRTGTGKITFADDTVNERATPVVQKNSWVHFAIVRESGTISAYANGVRGDTAADTVNLGNAEVLSIGANSTSLTFLGYISNVRIVKGSAVYSGSTYTVPTTPLTAIANTSLLTCQSNRFIDNSTNNFAITVAGNTSIQAFSPFNPTASWDAATNGGSGYFDGTGDYLRLADDAAFTLGSGDFTIECWLYPTAVGTTFRSFSGQSDSAGTATTRSFRTAITTAGKFEGVISKSTSPVNYIATSTSSAVANTWQHYAFVRDGNTTRLYINGVQDGTADVTGVTANNSSNQLGIGVQGEGTTSTFAGYMSDYRMVVGTCLYPNGTTFTPPTAPLTAISGTSLLCNFTNAGIYDATAKNDLETVGNAQISTTQSKFGGSSMYFDGTGDYLVAADNAVLELGGGDWTLECWYYQTVTQTYSALIGKSGTAAQFASYLLQVNSLTPTFYLSTTGSSYAVTITSSIAITNDAWHHLSVVRSGNTITLYVNGASGGSAAYSSTPYDGSYSFVVGAYGDGSYPINGYVQDVRITKGIARYTAAFTPPTTAFPVL